MTTIQDINTVQDLMLHWQKKHVSEHKDRFIFDGCPNEERYRNCPLNICFLLKECYFDPADNRDKPWVKYFKKMDDNLAYHLDENIHNEEPWFMWWRIQAFLNTLYSALANGLDINKPLELFSIVNIKKSEGKERSAYSDILDYAKSDKELIQKEIELLTPDIIVCGGTYNIAAEVGLFGQKSREICDFAGTRGMRKAYLYRCDIGKFHKDVVVIDMWHPTCSIGYKSFDEAIKSKSERIIQYLGR